MVSVAEKAGPDPAVVCLGETSESKPSMNGRKGIVDVETEVGGHLGTSLGGALKPGPSGIRLEGGVTPGPAKSADPTRIKLPMQGTGAELPVVGLKAL